jgi:hypothetical protein
MAFDPATGQFLLFGGNGPGGSYNDTWTWNGTTWSQVDDSGDAGCYTVSNPCPSSPGGRQGPTTAYDPATAQFVLFGGENISSSGVYNDTWTWNGTIWSQVDDSGDAGCGSGSNVCPSSPPGRQAGALVYDPATAQLVVFGGDNNTGPDNDSWTWNGTIWSQVDDSGDAGCTSSCTSSPPARFRMGADYDPATGQLVMFGGSYSISYNDTWTWNGSIWVQTSDTGASGCTNSCPQSPSARSGPTVAFDPATGQLVLFGGGSSLNDTWDWDYAALVLAPPSVSWSLTLNGYDQTVSTPVTVEVANEGRGGWDLTVQASSSFGAGFTSTINGSAVSAQANTSPSQSCVGSCVAASSNTVTYPITVAGSAVNLFTDTAGSGVGDMDLSTDWWLTVPAKAHAGTTSVTYTLTLSYGP